MLIEWRHPGTNDRTGGWRWGSLYGRFWPRPQARDLRVEVSSRWNKKKDKENLNWKRVPSGLRLISRTPTHTTKPLSPSAAPVKPASPAPAPIPTHPPPPPTSARHPTPFHPPPPEKQVGRHMSVYSSALTGLRWLYLNGKMGAPAHTHK